MAKKNVTFSDIAKYTNFSKTTISRYFNNPESLTLENQQKIADAVAALGYKENKVARILANGKTEFVGIIIPNLYMHYYASILNEILASYERFHYKFLVFAGSEDAEVERKYIQELLAYQIEGFIVLSHTLSSKELASYHIPVVTIEREDRYTCSVNTDNYWGATQAAALLHETGCDVLIHINSDLSPEVPAYQRIKGFCDTCKEKGLRHELVLEDLGNSYKENMEQLSVIMERIERDYPRQKKGIFLSNDTFANIALTLLLRKYGTMPEDFSIVGFDGSPISGEAIIPISTVAQRIDKMASEAVEMLVEQMNERKKRRPRPVNELVHKVVAPVLIERKTTGKRPAKSPD